MIWQSFWDDHSYNAPSFSIIRIKGVFWIEGLYLSTVLCSLNSESPVGQELLGLSPARALLLTQWKPYYFLGGNSPTPARSTCFVQKWVGSYKWRITHDEGNDEKLGKYSKLSMEEILKPKDEAFPLVVLALITASIYWVVALTLSRFSSPVLIAHLGKPRLREALRTSQWEQQCQDAQPDVFDSRMHVSFTR